MKKCSFKDQIDDYLFNRLDGEAKEKFEEHYFNCSSCFEEMAERNELIAVVKSEGQTIFKDEYIAQAAKGETWFEKISSFLTPRQWALSAVSAAMILVVVFGVLPYLKTTPEFTLNEDTFRLRTENKKITLIPPVIDMKAFPSKFEWIKLDDKEDIEYKVYIYDNGTVLWSGTTKENFIVLPEKTKLQLISTASEKYSWQVKAFSPEGTIISISSRVRFNIKKSE